MKQGFQSMRGRLWLAALTLAMVPQGVAADEPAPEPEGAPSRAVEAWLELQRSGEAAGPPRRMPSEAALLVYQEYLESFRLEATQPLVLPEADGR